MQLILILPLIVALVAFFMPNKLVKEFSLAFSGSFFLLSLYVLFKYDPLNYYNFIYYNETFLVGTGGSLHIGLDSIGVMMFALTNFVIFYVNIMAWEKTYTRSFYGCVFLMQFALIGVFASLNAILFYFFWELALLPIYYIVYKWGNGKELNKTFVRFFIYTFVGSLFILAAFILFAVETKSGSFEITEMAKNSLTGKTQILYTIFLLIGFGVKIPIFPLHSWQPSTYRKAPAEGTVLLSGIMLKMGLFGLLRWLVPFQDDALPIIQKVVIILAIIGTVYGAIIALRRNDLKLIAAFSSLSHVGLITAGIFAYKFVGFQGVAFQMLVHGINIVGILYIFDIIERSTGTRYLSDLGGISSKSPLFSALTLIIIIGTIAVTPLTNGFPGEFLLLMSVFLYNPILGILAGSTIILGAAYLLRVYQRAFMGEVSEHVSNFKAVSAFDLTALGFIALLVLVLGIYPQFILDISANGSQYLTNLLELKNN
ncbi:MAG: NuoM family protein [Chitinophagales bacterium]|nr:NADH-quinone oxidoreductase subunit M [Sphingobacteriales bacterium]